MQWKIYISEHHKGIHKRQLLIILPNFVLRIKCSCMYVCAYGGMLVVSMCVCEHVCLCVCMYICM